MKPKFNLMLDSGAHHFFEKHVRKGTGIWDRHLWNWGAYKSDAFTNYTNDYIHFLKENKSIFDVYVVNDAIYDPEVTYGNYCYMKYTHGLNPMPVYHFAEDIKWFKLYMKETDYIGISGLGQGISKNDYIEWADEVFELLCDNEQRIPTHKIHGFALTSVNLMKRYPYFSVDSSSWVQYSKYGMILLPKTKNGVYDYEENPLKVFVSTRSPKVKEEGFHYQNSAQYQKKYTRDYLKSIKVPFGKSKFKVVDADYKLKKDEKLVEDYADKGRKKIEKIVVPGVSNRHEFRDAVNFMFFTQLGHKLPKWPWSWKRRSKCKTLGIL